MDWIFAASSPSSASQGHAARNQNRRQVAQRRQGHHHRGQSLVAGRDTHHRAPRGQRADQPPEQLRGVVAVGKRVEHAGGALRAPVARVRAKAGKRNGAQLLQFARRGLDQEVDLPVAGMVTESDRRAVGRADAAVRREDQNFFAAQLRRIPTHARVLRQTEQIARGPVAKLLVGQRQRTLRAFRPRADVEQRAVAGVEDRVHEPNDRILRMQLTRRTVLAASYARILGANDRIGVGFIGYGLIGAQHVYDFKNQKDADLVALSEVYQPRLEAGKKACGPRGKGYPDFRRMLDDKDLQAVVVSTPGSLARAADDDGLRRRQGRLRRKAADALRSRRALDDQTSRGSTTASCQVGTQQRSGAHYQQGQGADAKGHIGKITRVRMASFRNIMPGFGAPPDGRAAGRLRLRHVARPRADAPLHSAPRASTTSAGSGTTPAAR